MVATVLDFCARRLRRLMFELFPNIAHLEPPEQARRPPEQIDAALAPASGGFELVTRGLDASAALSLSLFELPLQQQQHQHQQQ